MMFSISSINYNKISENIYNFFTYNKKIILISFCIAVFVNAIDIFTIKFGIDSEQYTVSKISAYARQQRYGSIILYYLLPFARFHILSQITGILALIFAALLIVSRHNISNNAKLLFVLLFITYPNFAFLQYFYFQSAYNFIGLLLVVIAYRIIDSNKYIFYIFAIIFLFIGISTYQSNLSVFLSAMMINVILDFINKKDYKYALYVIIKSIFVLLLSVLFYYIIIKIFSSGLHSLYQNMVIYSDDIFESLKKIFIHLFDILCSQGYKGSHTINIVISSIICCLFIYVIYSIVKYKNIKYNIFLIFLFFLFFLAVFSMDIITSGLRPIRVHYAHAFYPAFILFFIFIYNKNQFIKLCIITLTIITLIFHTYQIVKNQTAYYVNYNQDIIMAENIIGKLYDKYPDIYHGKYKLLFIGGVRHNYPLIRNGKEMFSLSYFNLFFATYKMNLFMHIVGLPYNVKQGYITDEIKKASENMPVYPDNNCIQLIGDTIVIKLN